MIKEAKIIISIYMHQFSQPLPPPLPHGPRSCPLPPVVWGGLGLVVVVVVGVVVGYHGGGGEG